MSSTFMGIELGKKGIMAHQTALQTTGHNITNAETEGYSRQKVKMETMSPLYDPSLNRPERAGQIGQGTVVARIERMRNMFIDDRIINMNDFLGKWKAKNDWLYEIELVHNEPTDNPIMNTLNEFWESWQELANNPSEFAVRKVVRERSVTLMKEINRTFADLKKIHNNVESTIQIRVKQINNITKKISDLNVDIEKSLNLGDSPNDLLDRRDVLIDQLSKMINVNVVRNEPDEFIVYWQGMHLIQGKHSEEIKLVANPAKNGFHDLFWGEINEKIDVKGGEMESLFDLRDNILKDQLTYMNNFTANLVQLVNEIHRDGFGLDGQTNRNYFNYIPATAQANGDYDSNNDGLLNSTALFKIAGNNPLNLTDKIGIAGTITFDANRPNGTPVQVNYVPTDTVEDVIDKINKTDAEIVAYLDHNKKLVLKATPAKSDDYKDFIIRHVEDSGDLLVNYSGILKANGAVGAYDWNNTGAAGQLIVGSNNYDITPLNNIASWVSLDGFIENDANKIAAASGTDYQGTGDVDTMTGIGDGSIALKIAGLRQKNAMIGEHSTFDQYFTALIADIGTKAEQAKMEFEITEQLAKNLENLRKSISGVNLDEELANMVMFQHGYNASARIVTTMDRMLDTIINRMGV